MTEIKRYVVDRERGDLLSSEVGDVCEWYDVEALLKERDELRAEALAAAWLLPEDIGIRELRALREEARAVFMGKDKQVIAKLQDELRYAQEQYQHAIRPPRPGVNMVYGFKPSIDNKIGDFRYTLMITKLQHAPNGGLEIEVQLP